LSTMTVEGWSVFQKVFQRHFELFVAHRGGYVGVCFLTRPVMFTRFIRLVY
jgi:hypothetical protein